MKVLVTGAKGQLGTDVVLLLKENGYDVYGFGRDEMDITNQEKVDEVITSIRPDVVIHTAAYTKVDQAELEPDKAFQVNAIGTRNVAVAAHKIDAKLIYISTDYVFDGTATEPIDEFQPTNPQTIYGKSKLAGEQYVRELHNKFFIVRTSWVYGAHGNNFVKTMLKLSETMDEIKVVADQIGSPTYAVDLAEKLAELCVTEKYGTYHISNEGKCSWYEFAYEIFKFAGKEIKVIPCTTGEFPSTAKRPNYSVLKPLMLEINGFGKAPNWRNSLKMNL
ncbi:dTDP-4-dehydrorhamnose reductase [Psychrobacillus sp. NPDC096623]|uniref:dTDP-4-dehydrorhamnose reductase n=1 Tax=Psychrobacillus sp. NPDC096623 TaxID=3364492 RepID=UPI00380AB01F